MKRSQLLVRPSRFLAEQFGELRVSHSEAGTVVEIILIKMECAVAFEVDQFVQDELNEFGLPIGGQAHQLVLSRIDLEACVIGKRGVEQAERMREVQFSQ